MIGELGLTYDEAYKSLLKLVESIRSRESPHECINNCDDEVKPYVGFIVGFLLGMYFGLEKPHKAFELKVMFTKAVNGDNEALKEFMVNLDV